MSTTITTKTNYLCVLVDTLSVWNEGRGEMPSNASAHELQWKPDMGRLLDVLCNHYDAKIASARFFGPLLAPSDSVYRKYAHCYTLSPLEDAANRHLLVAITRLIEARNTLCGLCNLGVTQVGPEFSYLSDYFFGLDSVLIPEVCNFRIVVVAGHSDITAFMPGMFHLWSWHGASASNKTSMPLVSPAVRLGAYSDFFGVWSDGWSSCEAPLHAATLCVQRQEGRDGPLKECLNALPAAHYRYTFTYRNVSYVALLFFSYDNIRGAAQLLQTNKFQVHFWQALSEGDVTSQLVLSNPFLEMGLDEVHLVEKNGSSARSNTTDKAENHQQANGTTEKDTPKRSWAAVVGTGSAPTVAKKPSEKPTKRDTGKSSHGPRCVWALYCQKFQNGTCEFHHPVEEFTYLMNMGPKMPYKTKICTLEKCAFVEEPENCRFAHSNEELLCAFCEQRGHNCYKCPQYGSQ